MTHEDHPPRAPRRMTREDRAARAPRGAGASLPQRLRPKARRLAALIKKETRQMVRDPASIAIGVVLPLILILLFGFGLSLDVKNVPVAIDLESSSPAAIDLVAGF